MAYWDGICDECGDKADSKLTTPMVALCYECWDGEETPIETNDRLQKSNKSRKVENMEKSTNLSSCLVNLIGSWIRLYRQSYRDATCMASRNGIDLCGLPAVGAYCRTGEYAGRDKAQ